MKHLFGLQLVVDEPHSNEGNYLTYHRISQLFEKEGFDVELVGNNDLRSPVTLYLKRKDLQDGKTQEANKAT